MPAFAPKITGLCVQLSSPLTWRYYEQNCVPIALRMRKITNNWWRAATEGCIVPVKI